LLSGAIQDEAQCLNLFYTTALSEDTVPNCMFAPDTVPSGNRRCWWSQHRLVSI
jgi:hypothetical protein